MTERHVSSRRRFEENKIKLNEQISAQFHQANKLRERSSWTRGSPAPPSTEPVRGELSPPPFVPSISSTVETIMEGSPSLIESRADLTSAICNLLQLLRNFKSSKESELSRMTVFIPVKLNQLSTLSLFRSRTTSLIAYCLQYL